MIFYSKFYIPQLKHSLIAAKNEFGLCYIHLSGSDRGFLKAVKNYLNEKPVRKDKELTEEVRQIREYFAGKRRNFELKVYLKGTGFRNRVWQALAETGYGDTISYSELAKRSGSSKAVRAAASGCAVNPVPVVIPCHRVIAKDGSIGGFGGGIKMKEIMLKLEKVNRDKY